MHVFPSPSYPSLHTHVYDPTPLVHMAFVSQSLAPVTHSSLSTEYHQIVTFFFIQYTIFIRGKDTANNCCTMLLRIIVIIILIIMFKTDMPTVIHNDGYVVSVLW